MSGHNCPDTTVGEWAHLSDVERIIRYKTTEWLTGVRYGKKIK